MFKTESIMVDVIIKSIGINSGPKSKFSGRKAILTEVKIGYGIPDVVVVSPKKNNRSYSLSYFDLTILGIIEKRKKMCVEELLKITGSSKKNILKSLSIMTTHGFLNLKNECVSFNAYDYSIKASGTIAIEAKLHDWKRALEQAYRYKWFSNYSYVFLPKKTVKRAISSLNEFKRREIGLASIDPSGDIEFYYEPKESKPISLEMNRFLNEKYIVNTLTNA